MSLQVTDCLTVHWNFEAKFCYVSILSFLKKYFIENTKKITLYNLYEKKKNFNVQTFPQYKSFETFENILWGINILNMRFEMKSVNLMAGSLIDSECKYWWMNLILQASEYERDFVASMIIKFSMGL